MALIVAQATFPQMAPIVGSRFLDRAHYNEFVESRSKSWALMRWRLVFKWKVHRIGRPNIPGRRDPSLEDGNGPTPLGHTGASFLSLGLPLLPGRPPFFVRSLMLYMLLFCSSSSYSCQSSMSILECTSHRPFFLELYELLWPPSHCPGVRSTLMVSRCQL